MGKKVFALLFPVILMSCATSNFSTLSYSAVFSISVRSTDLPDSTIFYSDELSLKLKGGQMISGKIISSESENLPAEFDIRKYPDYILGLASAKKSHPKLDQLFSNSNNEIAHTYGLENIKVKSSGEITYYSLCKNKMCLAYVVKQSFKDHILTIHATGFSNDYFDSFLQGEVNVN